MKVWVSNITMCFDLSEFPAKEKPTIGQLHRTLLDVFGVIKVEGPKSTGLVYATVMGKVPIGTAKAEILAALEKLSDDIHAESLR